MKKIRWLPILILLVFIAGCGGRDGESTQDINMLYTSAAQTAYAQLTLLAPEQAPPTATNTATLIPTNTPPPPATFTPIIQATTPVQGGSSGGATYSTCDAAEFLADVTIPDGTEVAPGAPFTKTWRVGNQGTCRWNSQYQVIYYFGDIMGAATSYQLTALEVAPGETLDISINMVAPDFEGHYVGHWLLRNGKGEYFGIGVDAGSLYVDINVVIQTATETATPTNTSEATSAADTDTPTPTTEPATDTPTPTDTPTATSSQ